MGRVRKVLFIGNMASTHLSHWAKIYKATVGPDTRIDIATFDKGGGWPHGRVASLPRVLLRLPRPLRAAVLALKVFWISVRYDLVHVHSVGWYGVASLATLRRPIVTIYGSEVQLKSGWSIRRTAQFALFSRAAVVHVTSQTMASRLRAKYPSCHIVCMHTGVDLAEIWTSRGQAGESSEIIIGHVRSVAPNYRTKEIIRTLRNTLLRDPHCSMVVFSGHSDPAYLAECRDLALALGLESKITFLGFLDRESLAKQLSRMTVALSLPHRDQVGASIVEALSAGVPVILTGGDVYRELHGLQGCYFLESIADLPRVIRQVISSSPALRKSLLPKEYTLDHVVSVFSTILHKYV